MKAGSSLLYPVLGVATFIAFIHIHGVFYFNSEEPKFSFVQRDGKQLMLDGRPFYVNGWNSYWLMDQAVEISSRQRVSKMFQIGAKMGLTVCRTWAFNDGAHNALQVSLGRFDERVFKALDRVIVEARKNGIRLLLSLVNNLQHYGGKTQYVKWAWDEGIALTSSNDSFFFDPSIRIYFKIYLKTILTRKNHLTGIEYRDDPTIFAWELMNEPQCISDSSGDTLQEWIEEMAQYVKSIDSKHLVTIGLEGFYGSTSSPEKLSVNPGAWYNTVGSDFIRNSKVSAIDFASVHIYPDQWLMDAELDKKIEYISKWMASHIEDGEEELKKPILFTEFGLSNKNKNFDHSDREAFYKTVFDSVYESAKKNGAGAGALIWQLLVKGMENYNDDFGIFPGDRPPLDNLVKEQSCRLAALRHGENLAGRKAREIC
ncbi:mannan endo-1,4-beta-mannosidase 2-like [Typha angustifolia]|uniref:mannan endo-1,4-beta-mannosidase 2-like n=1 Tax=Typha angustifolia TaxID=59011 RepID=UPI003C30995A